MKKIIDKKKHHKTLFSPKVSLKSVLEHPNTKWIGHFTKKKRPIFFSLLLVYLLFNIYAINPFFLVGSNFNPDYSSLGGLDIYYLNENDSDNEFSCMTALTISENKKDTVVYINVKSNTANVSFPKKIMISFPGHTRNHLNVQSIDLSGDELIFLSATELYHSSRHNIDENISIYWDELTGTEFIEIETQKISNFDGAIEFVWPNSIQKTSLFKIRVDLPFGAVTPFGVDENWQRIDAYELQVSTPSNYWLDNSIPQPIQYMNIVQHGIYKFMIDPKNDFKADFSHNNSESYENFLLLISSILLGIFISQILTNEK